MPFDPKHLIAWMFLAAAVYVAAMVPAAGVVAYVDLTDEEIVTHTIATLYYGSDTDTSLANDPYDVGLLVKNSTSDWVVHDLGVTGTAASNNFQMPSTVSTLLTANWDMEIAIVTNWTVADLKTKSAVRMNIEFSFTNLGLVQPNISDIVVYSADTSTPSGFNQLAAASLTSEIVINGSTSPLISVNVDWTLATLITYHASHSAKNLVVLIRFSQDENVDGYPFANEIWSSAIKFKYSEVSKAQTWLYSILGSTGFMIGILMLLPLVGITASPFVSYSKSSYKKYRSKNRNRSRNSRNYRRKY